MYILDHRPMQQPLKSYVDDLPASVCPVIHRFAQIVERGVLDATRREEMMVPLLPHMLDTAGSNFIATQFERAFQIVDWEVRTCTPAIIRVFESLDKYADAIEAAPTIIDSSRLDFTHTLADQIASEAFYNADELPDDDSHWLWDRANDIKTTIVYAKRGHQNGVPTDMLRLVRGAPDSFPTAAMQEICFRLQVHACELIRHLCTVTVSE